MSTRVPIQDYTHGDNNDRNDNLRSADSYIDGNLNEIRDNDCRPCDVMTDADRISEGVTEDNLEHDEGSNTVGCLDESYKNANHIRTVVIDDDRSSLESSGSLKNCCNILTAKDVLPVETARARFLEIILDNFVSEHVIEKWGVLVDNHTGREEDKSNKRKSGEVHYEGDPNFVLPLMHVANLYETLVSEVNIRIASLNGLREKTIGVALEASGGLYRKLSQKFPKTGSYSFKRRELATSLETRAKFPELVVQEEKRVRFVVANGLDIVEKPYCVPAADAEWFKRLTGRSDVAITSRDYKFYNPRRKVRRASLNASPTIAGLPTYPSVNDHDIHSVEEVNLNYSDQYKIVSVAGPPSKSPREQETPSKEHMIAVHRQHQFEPVILSHHHALNQNQEATLLSQSHDSEQPSHLPDMTQAHQSPTLSQNMGSLQPLTENHLVGHLNMMASSPAKFCDECGSPYLRPTSKFCSQCGTKRFGT